MIALSARTFDTMSSKLKRHHPSVDAGILCATAILLLVLFAPAWGAESPDDSEDAVRVRRVKSGNHVSLFIENGAPCDVTVTLRVLTKNARISRVKPETATYPALSETEAARISAEDPRKRWKWRCRFNWVKGRLRTRHDGRVVYQLPFEKGRSYRVVQGYQGASTHHGRDEYAIDFGMRKGTPVCAARDGIVVDLKESSKTGGSDEKYRNMSNFVSIAHDDGTIAEYHHLHYEGVLVELGQQVEAGQRIGISGNTGYSTGPHLHFGVYSAVDGRHRQSHPVTFATRHGIVRDPVEGQKYTAR
jgi:murein DD-endopeptidase MepM/ murein hydrolase activator NlpD